MVKRRGSGLWPVKYPTGSLMEILPKAPMSGGVGFFGVKLFTVHIPGASSPAVKHEFNNIRFNDPHIQQPWIQQSWIQGPSHSTILGFNKLRFNDPHIQQYFVSTTLGFNNLEFNNLGFNNPWIQQS